MKNLKDLMKTIQDDESSENEIEVYADSVKQALELAAGELGVDISELDYQILEKGTSGFLGIGRQPYRVLVRPIITEKEEEEDFAEIEQKLHSIHEDDLRIKDVPKDVDGSAKIRVTKTGIWLTITPPKGNGRRVDLSDISNKIYALRIQNADMTKVEKEVRKPSGKPVKIGDWIPNPEYDGTMTVEITDDEMKAFVHFVPPRFCGRHMDVDDVIEALKRAGVVTGIKEERIAEYLDRMDYSQPLLAAEGTPPRHGRDAYIDYKVRIDKSGIQLEEDEKGRVDFKDLDLIENVVVGQVLAVKVPAEEGVPGRTVTNRIIPARSGKDIQIRYGKGTILSQDGTELTAEINGQVVYQNGKLSVEPVFIVKGDVSTETGDVVFLGSVIVSGSVQDNFTVKAAGNIEIKGTVQKANLEAEGDIIIRQGIMGREGARIESTGGSIIAKFIQTATVVAEKDVIVAEGIVHSNVDAGNRIICNGRRARIVGGLIRAGEEVNSKYVGSDSFTKTIVRVGMNPKVLQQLTELEENKRVVSEEFDKVRKDVTTLTVQKNNAGGHLPKDREELLGKLIGQKQKLEQRLNEINLSLEELKAYLNMLEQKGKVCVEKTIFPGVEIYIKDKRFNVKDPYNYVKFALEGADIRISEYEPPDLEESQKLMIRRRR
ncbi:MAG TPA: FapA family protein [Spirochaetota bacterium]|nr:FapA family protein [Spirochaetota bacterium]HOM10428.1 FapA family protein [Spirochaetota bacterium]HPP49098.1 FapA family protein [Spirochaetota bacterium]